MITTLSLLGSATLVLYGLIGLDLVLGNRSIRFLRDVRPVLPPSPPRVSIIAAARNEGRNIREAVLSLLKQDYPDYELIVVDDRSDDETGSILDGLARDYPRLKVMHVGELPDGWLGKNHALWVGQKNASGELLLFTDADIVMEPSTLKRAVAYLLEGRLDHLALTPEMRMPGVFLGMFGAAFVLFFCMYTRPWKATDPRSRYHIGIGAFNLVRAAAYREVGGHETIALRPDDDMKLGKIIKMGGFRQELLFGTGLLSVEWYSSVGELVHGLEKNAFAGTDYSVPMVLFGALFHCLCSVWPFIAVFVTHGTTRLIYAAVVALIAALSMDSAGFHGTRRWYVIGFPFTALLFVYIVIRATALNLVHGGITWRGTSYPLDRLKSNRV